LGKATQEWSSSPNNDPSAETHRGNGSSKEQRSRTENPII